MYSSYEVCFKSDCDCDHHGGGVWRAQHVSLVEAYNALHRAYFYRAFIVRDEDGHEREVA